MTADQVQALAKALTQQVAATTAAFHASKVLTDAREQNERAIEQVEVAAKAVKEAEDALKMALYVEQGFAVDVGGDHFVVNVPPHTTWS